MGTVVRTGGLQGIDGCQVNVEVDLCRGLPAFHLVGLPNTAVRESRERVLAAVRNSGYRLPAGRVTVNLAPADVRKEGSGHDLAIAVAVVAAERARLGETVPGPERGVLLGELSLFGEVRPVRGLLPIVLDVRSRGGTTVAVPAGQAWEARLVPGIEVVAVRSLRETVDWYLRGTSPAAERPACEDRGRTDGRDRDLETPARSRPLQLGHLAQQPLACRAAMLAAAGRHHLLLLGPPGAGKTRLAHLLWHLLPDLTPEEALTVTRIHSAAGLLTTPGLVRRPPLRAPHHTITTAGLLGGGARLRPGEVTLAHRGILLLDELPEFGSQTLDALREPLTEGVVRIARNTGHCAYPAMFQLVATANACRCGFVGSRVRACTCGATDRARYRARLSGPLRDRFDLTVEMGDGQSLPLLAPVEPDAASGSAQACLQQARRLLVEFRSPPAAWPLARRIRGHGLDQAAVDVLERSRVPLGLSIRGVLRACRVARTIAALDGRREIIAADVQEAVQYRYEALGQNDA
ncbi:MAG: YifB family Mg chelatase-like AAA ATPase [Candidatus Krumholzibacteria bacterium]|jgi:magnesium chelatase family protein|nr:YifB family Mg chelatase-like AAA ATPase [Candidatus Krumholzibacteria bacterium]